MPRLRALLLLLLPAVPLSVVGLVAGCEDVRLPAIVPDGGTGAGGSGGETHGSGGETHGSGGDDDDHPEPTCAPPTKPCGKACYDLEVSNEHCGDCDKACSGGASCFEGKCVCPPDEKDCDGLCVHTESDPENCGECGKDCASGVCTRGECKP